VGKHSTPGPQEKRFAAYMDGLAQAAGHADRAKPLQLYCTGLLLPGERKSVEPMAARLAPDNVRRVHQSLHHLVADAPWSEEALLERMRGYVLPAMREQGPVVAWIIDDTSFLKRGRHSVGVARQYCGEVGKQENCQVAVSLSISTKQASVPIAWRLYLPESWAGDKARRQSAGVPEAIHFQTKSALALQQIEQAIEAGISKAPLLADAWYGRDHQFRERVSQLGLTYMVGILEGTSVWRPGQAPLPRKSWSGRGRRPKLLRRDAEHQPVSVKELALGLPAASWKQVTWREGSQQKLRSRFAAVHVRPSYLDDRRTKPHAEEWLLVEWPVGEIEPTRYWLSSLPATSTLAELVRLAKHRWIIERDYQELKQELGLGHYEGRGWRGFHHHAALCIAAYGFLVAERSRFPPSARADQLALRTPPLPPDFRPRGSSRSGRAA
jgi:SRSO17 transposase